MNWVQGMLDDEKIFPSKIGVPFPPNFLATIKSIVRRLFRVYAHLYNHHFAQLCALSIEAHINTSYRHFLIFVNEVGLAPIGNRARVLTRLRAVQSSILSTRRSSHP